MADDFTLVVPEVADFWLLTAFSVLLLTTIPVRVYWPCDIALGIMLVVTMIVPMYFTRLYRIEKQIFKERFEPLERKHNLLDERNNKLDARDYDFASASRSSTNPSPASKPYRQNQYGYTLGGPIQIPKIFNGKNRLFFMSNYEGPTGDELDPMLGSFCDKAGVGEESARQWLYFLARLGLVSLDVNASRSRFFVIEPV